MSVESERYAYLLKKIKCLRKQVCTLENNGSTETDPLFSASPAFGITTPNITAWNSVASGSYITTNTSQTGLTGDKTTSGLWTFTAPWSTGQAIFGSVGQAGSIRFLNGANGAASLSLGYVGAVTSGALLNSSLTDGLTIRNTAANGFVSIEAINASGYLNFLSGATQAARLFANGNLRIGTSTADDGSKLRVDGNVTIAGNILPEANGTRTLGSVSFNYAGLYTTSIVSQGTFNFDKGAVGNLLFRNGSSGTILGGFHATTGNYFLQASGAAPADSGERLQVVGSTKLDGVVSINGTETHIATNSLITSAGTSISLRNTASAGTTNIEANGATGQVNLTTNSATKLKVYPSSITIKNGGTFTERNDYLLSVEGNSRFTDVLRLSGAYGTTFGQILTGNVNQAGIINFARGSDSATAHYVGYSSATEAHDFRVHAYSAAGTVSLSVLGGVGLKLFSTQNIAIGSVTDDTINKLQVTGTSKFTADMIFPTIGTGVILKSPDNTSYRITVANGGAISTVAV